MYVLTVIYVTMWNEVYTYTNSLLCTLQFYQQLFLVLLYVCVKEKEIEKREEVGGREGERKRPTKEILWVWLSLKQFC